MQKTAKASITITVSQDGVQNNNLLSVSFGGIRKILGSWHPSNTADSGWVNPTGISTLWYYRLNCASSGSTVMRLGDKEGLMEPLKPGSTYTLTAYVRGQGTVRMYVAIASASSPAVSLIEDTWQRMSITFTVPDSYDGTMSLSSNYIDLVRFSVNNASHFVVISRAKLEEGNMATEYCQSEYEKVVKPTIDPHTKHWMLDDVDLGIKAEGSDGAAGAAGAAGDVFYPHVGDDGTITFTRTDASDVPAGDVPVDPVAVQYKIRTNVTTAKISNNGTPSPASVNASRLYKRGNAKVWIPSTEGSLYYSVNGGSTWSAYSSGIAPTASISDIMFRWVKASGSVTTEEDIIADANVPVLLDGANGQDGADGQNGANGQDGAPGPAGPAGPAGQNGTNGQDGQDGRDGTDGKDATAARPNLLKNSKFDNTTYAPNAFAYSIPNNATANFSASSSNVTFEPYENTNAVCINNLVEGSRRSIRIIMTGLCEGIKPNTTYVASIYVKMDVAHDMWAAERISSGDYTPCTYLVKHVPASVWTRVIVRFTTGSSPKQNESIYIGCDIADNPYTKICFAKPKLEEGGDATPWCPSVYEADIVSFTGSKVSFDAGKITATGSGAYAISKLSYVTPCYAQFRYSTAAGMVKVALQSDISESSIADNSKKLYSFLLNSGSGVVQVGESGTNTAISTAGTFTSLFRISYDGLHVRYYIDGELVHTSAVLAANKGKPLFMVVYIGPSTKSIDDVEFGKEQPFMSKLSEKVQMAETDATAAQKSAADIDKKLTTPAQLRELLNEATGLIFEGGGKFQVPAAGHIRMNKGSNAGMFLTPAGVSIIGEKSGEQVFITSTNICGATASCTDVPQTNPFAGGTTPGSGAMTSDMRLKTVQHDIELTADQIATAPIFDFFYKDGIDKDEHSGTSAQYWQEILPNVVHEGADGFLRLEYDQAALVAVVSLAREVQMLKAEIGRLKQI